jgi:hypothetical protein
MAYKMKGFSGFKNSPLKQETIKRGRKRHLRNLERNKSGRNATVKMGTDILNQEGIPRKEGPYHAWPTITFKGDEPPRDQSFDEALDKGEVYEFKSKRRAEKFAAGSWKKGKDRKDAMRDYRKKKRAIKRNFSKVRPLYFDMD